LSSGIAAAAERVGRYRWVILGLAFTAQMSNALASQAVAPLAPLFQGDLNLTKAEVGAFSSAVYAGSWVVLLLVGSITDRVGVRKMIALGQVVTGLSLFSMSVAGSFFHAAAVMFAAGVGRASISPGVSKAVMDWFSPSTRATAMGAIQTSVPLGGILTASLLPTLGLVLGWRSAIALIGLWVIGGATASGFLYRDVAAQGRQRTHRVGARRILYMLAGNRKLWSLSIIALLFSAVQVSVTTYLVLYLEEVVLVPLVPDRSLRIVTAGGYLALCQAGGIVARIVWGVISDRYFRNRRLVVIAATGALAAMVSAAVALLGSECPLWLLPVLVFAYGGSAIGWGGLYLALAAEISGNKYSATGVGLSMTVMQLGNVAGPPLFGFLVDVTGSYQAGWFFLATLSVAGTLMAAFGSRKPRPLA